VELYIHAVTQDHGLKIGCVHIVHALWKELGLRARGETNLQFVLILHGEGVTGKANGDNIMTGMRFEFEGKLIAITAWHDKVAHETVALATHDASVFLLGHIVRVQGSACRFECELQSRRVLRDQCAQLLCKVPFDFGAVAGGE
jgi:hypothetical protein